MPGDHDRAVAMRVVLLDAVELLQAGCCRRLRAPLAKESVTGSNSPFALRRELL